MVQSTPMNQAQRERIVQLARADREFWELLKKKEIELKEYYDAHPDVDVAEGLPQPTLIALVERFVEKHFGHVPNFDWGGGDSPIARRNSSRAWNLIH